MRLVVLQRPWIDWREAPRIQRPDEALRVARPDSAAQIHQSLATTQLAQLGTPLHYLVASDRLRRDGVLSQCHVWSRTLPAGSLIGIEDGTLICSPEFFLLLRASGRSFADLLMETQLILGTHVLTRGPKSTRECKPMSTKAQLMRFLDGCSGLRGSERLSQVAALALENAASPPESMLGGFYSLPPRKGGIGITSLELNHEVPTPQGAGQRYGQPKRVCDLYIPELKLDIEYASDERHSADWERRADAVRRNQLEMAGVSVMDITSDQLHDLDALLTIGRNLYQRLGRRWNMSPAWRTRAEQLHRELLAAKDAMKRFM